jgi:hypothetical protein
MSKSIIIIDASKGTVTVMPDTHYALIETWNGEGYSTDNKARRIKLSPSEVSVFLANKVAELKKLGFRVRASKRRKKYISYCDDEDNYGTVQLKAITNDDIWGVVIMTNINDCRLVDWKMYHIMLGQALEQSDPKEKISRRNPFIGAYNEYYDYQFIELT